MKTITEYIPLIFSRIDAHAAGKAARRQRFKIDAALIAGYSLFGLWLSSETGLAPGNWQFWLCFGPLLVASEMAVHAVLNGWTILKQNCEFES